MRAADWRRLSDWRGRGDRGGHPDWEPCEDRRRRGGQPGCAGLLHRSVSAAPYHCTGPKRATKSNINQEGAPRGGRLPDLYLSVDIFPAIMKPTSGNLSTIQGANLNNHPSMNQ